MVLDFREIPSAKGGREGADTFEVFAADFLKLLGYQIVQGPSRGQDGGRDLVAEETRKGISRSTTVKWLVSCKHYVHSNKAVGRGDEPDVIERLKQHDCSGFIGIYSTLPSSGLEERLSSQGFEFQIYTPNEIEKYLLDDANGIKLAEGYFPSSLSVWARENPRPVDFFEGDTEVLCDYCGRNLLEDGAHGIYVVMQLLKERRYTGIHFVCKGDCDRRLTPSLRGEGEIDGWDDIDDLKIPIVFIRKMFSLTNEIRGGTVWDDEAYNKYRQFLVKMSRYVLRQTSSREQERIGGLKILWDSGLG